MITYPLININSLAANIQKPISSFAQLLLERFSGSIESILVYGSSAGINYVHNVSNINAAVIFKKLDFNMLTQANVCVSWGKKHKIAAPLLLTKEFIVNALDVFPIEFTEIKEQHVVIYGEDFFKELIVPRQDVRLLCEQQVKGKLLRLRQAYLDIGPNQRLLKNILISSFSDLLPIFRQLILLKGFKPAIEIEAMLGQLAEIFSLDPKSFIAVLHDKRQKYFISARDVQLHLENFLNQLEILSRHMDVL